MPDEPSAAEGGDHDDLWVDLSAPSDSDGSADPSPEQADGELRPRRGRGRLIVGIIVLVAGLAVTAAAIATSGDDDASTSKPTGQLVGSSMPVTTTSATTPAIVPTTLAGGVLPTGCGTWDHAFDVSPDPVTGLAIYSDFGGWHVRLGPDGPASVSGSVKGQTMPVRAFASLPEGVVLTDDPQGAALTFSITAGTEPVGFDFNVTCEQKQLTFDLKGPDGAALPAKDVQVGLDGTVTAVPVIAQRTVTPPG